MINIKDSLSCNVCGSENLETVFDAPSLPLTGLYIHAEADVDIDTYDQGLMYCMACGHGQLRRLIPAAVLYDSTYTHRTSASPIATRGNDFFYHHLCKIVSGRKFKSLLEVGCNDLYLLNLTQDIAVQSVGIDPIWIGKDHLLNSNTRVLGRFIEDIDFDNDIGVKPDIILSAHTFEHIQELYVQLSSLVDLAADNCLFVIEVPGFDSMVKLRRFDQVFHQHIQYTSLSSMRGLIDRLGCTYLGHVFNYSYWGGTLMFWFERRRDKTDFGLRGFEMQRLNVVKNAFSGFKAILESTVDQTAGLGERCLGFGAAQMLPVLAYHMESNLEFLDAILDDNPDRSMCRLPGVKPLIQVPVDTDIEDTTIFITALDSVRPIISRLNQLRPRRIIVPLHIM